jgi:unsaturated rhamnogalacturonyl hydrolase
MTARDRSIRRLCALAALAAGIAGAIPTKPLDAQPRSASAAPRAVPAPSGKRWSYAMSEAVMKRKPETHRRWDYTAGVVLGAMERVAIARRDSAMLRYVRVNTDRWVKPDGMIEGFKLDEYNLDQIAQGMLLFGLAERTRDPRYWKAADVLREQLRRQPRTSEGGFWHKNVYPQQMWLDGLFMAQPFYVRYATEKKDTAAFSDITRQFLLVARHTRDPQTGLLVHGWDAARAQRWADSSTGRAPNAWGRAMGWYLMAVVETIERIPAQHPDRDAVIRVFQDAVRSVADVQDPVTGLWWQVLDQGDRTGNYLESSASSMFAYALAKGARLGWLDASYRKRAERAFDGLVTNLVSIAADGMPVLHNVCEVAGLGGNLRRDGSYRDGSFAYYVSEPVVDDDYKGVGPFILAALELGR